MFYASFVYSTSVTATCIFYIGFLNRVVLKQKGLKTYVVERVLLHFHSETCYVILCILEVDRGTSLGNEYAHKNLFVLML
jgi:hypothetical protein